tara:strand:- start:141 stop:296 length:156 start_codon:yes stop_codon:yes gene_type:complete
MEALGLSLWNLGTSDPQPFELRINNDPWLKFSKAEDAISYIVYLSKNKGEA